jgi:hypothetical protein
MGQKRAHFRILDKRMKGEEYGWVSKRELDKVSAEGVLRSEDRLLIEEQGGALRFSRYASDIP